MSTTRTSPRARQAVTTLAAVLATSAALVLPATTSASAAAPPDRTSVRAADTWTFAGYFPDPITCHAAGIASGSPYTCNFIFVGFTLWLRSA
jgi:hypothetical protein